MKLLASFAVLAAATIGAASASPLQYNTTGSFFTGSGFSTGNNTAQATVNGSVAGDVATLTFNPLGPTFVGTPTNVSYGFVDLSFAGNTADTISIPAFTITVMVNNMTDTATANFVGSVPAGTIASGSSTLVISFAANPLSDGSANFTINTPTNIPANSSLFGEASLQGAVTNATPEPSSAVLLAAGLIGLGFSARKKLAGRI